MILAKSKQTTLIDAYMGVICCFPIVTVLIDGSAFNKILFGLLITLHIAMILINPMKRSSFLSLFLLALNYVFAIINTSFPLINENLLFYYPFFFLYTYFICDHQDKIWSWFCSHEKFIRTIIGIWTIIVGISIFVPSCYYVKEGGELYFGSFCGSIFRLGPSAVFIEVLAILCLVLYRRKLDVLYFLVPLYCFFMGSSRAYLAVGGLVFVVAWYIICIRKRIFWATIIPAGLAALWLVGKTAIGDKIAFTLDDTQFGDFWFRVSSGRSIFWADDLNAWAESSVLRKWLGNGLNFTLNLTGLWAHNDFIEILCSVGILGLIHYLYVMRYMLRKGYGNVRIPWVVALCVFMAWFLNAFFNMHYVYFCAMLCYPFLVFAVREHCKQRGI